MNWIEATSLTSAIQRRCRAHIACVALLAACALFLFVDRRTPPIILWDESRLAVNALEMNHSGWSLITTYGFVPDLWNSKPPLMIWLMNASISIFGASELSLRLPAMIAAIGTLAVVFAFVCKATHSISAAVVAVMLLTTSAAFFGEHGARTADYDSLLCFFTTAYLSILYFAVHHRIPPRRHIFAAGALLAAATMTKTIAGLVPGAGVALYLLVSGRVRRAFATPRYALMLVVALLPIALFYIVRERLSPGYLHAVWYNDFVGRYEDQLGLDPRPWWFYLQALLRGGIFSAGPLALFAPVGLVGTRGRARDALLYALSCVVAQLLLISVPATRLVQYILPALPWLAIACAIAAFEQFKRIAARDEQFCRTRRGLVLLSGVATAAVLVIALPAAKIRYDLLPRRAFYPRASYGALFGALRDRRIARVTVIEPGIQLGTLDAYAPQLRYYALLWDSRGMSIDGVEQRVRAPVGSTIASCDPALSHKLIALGGQAIGADGCAAITDVSRDRQLVQREVAVTSFSDRQTAGERMSGDRRPARTSRASFSS